MTATGTQLHRHLLALLVVACAAALLPAGALAKNSPGVHIDPKSPQAKEYSIPLGNARGNGTQGTSKLFGNGITKHSSTTPTTSTTPTSHKKTGHKAKKSTSKSQKKKSSKAGAATGSPKPPTHQKQASPGTAIGTNASSSTGVTWMIVVALIVLVLGGLGGAALARRNRRSTPSPS